MGKLNWYLSIAATMLFVAVAVAGTQYVNMAANGDNTGNDWTNAYKALPARLVRGDTYYVADGNYGYHDFIDAPSGDQIITVRKATPEDHGSDIGWIDGYGDGVAMFTALSFSQGRYVFDGVVGTGQYGHGFEVYHQAAADTVVILVRIRKDVRSVRMRHTRVHRPSLDYRGAGIYAVYGGTADVEFSHCYLHDIFGVHCYLDRASGITIDHCYMERNKSTSAVHSESIQARGTTNLVVKNSVFADIQGTGVIISGSGDSASWTICGNVFYASPGFQHGNGHGTIADNFNGSIRDVVVNNNTFVGIQAGKSGMRFYRSAGGCQSFNNLYYDCHGVGYLGTEHDYETLIYSLVVNGEFSRESHDVIVQSGDPFVDVGSRDFRLAKAIDGGADAECEHCLRDPAGRQRGADGCFDRGAYEFCGTQALPAPKGGVVVP